ncbi:hypothetical protein [Rubritalea tangerina]|uniref:hypothetical protein n=1 Tax=Rubritalea tangerina TaxID=430798 RepID=UPI00360F3766
MIYRVDARLPVGFTTRVWLLPNQRATIGNSAQGRRLVWLGHRNRTQGNGWRRPRYASIGEI